MSVVSLLWSRFELSLERSLLLLRLFVSFLVGFVRVVFGIFYLVSVGSGRVVLSFFGSGSGVCSFLCGSLVSGCRVFSIYSF